MATLYNPPPTQFNLVNEARLTNIKTQFSPVNKVTKSNFVNKYLDVEIVGRR